MAEYIKQKEEAQREKERLENEAIQKAYGLNKEDANEQIYDWTLRGAHENWLKDEEKIDGKN